MDKDAWIALFENGKIPYVIQIGEDGKWYFKDTTTGQWISKESAKDIVEKLYA